MIVGLLIIGSITAVAMGMAVYELRRANRELRAVYNKMHEVERGMKTNPRFYITDGSPKARREPIKD